MKKRFVCTVFAMAGLLLMAGRESARAFSRRDLLPEQAMAVVEISHGSDLIKAFGQTGLAQMWSDPLIQQFLGKPDLSKALRELIFEDDENNAEIASLLWETVRMLKGETLVVFPAMPADRTGIEFYLVAHISEQDFLRSMDVDRRIADLMVDRKLTIRQHRFQDVDLIQHIEDRPDKLGDKPQETWQAFLADTLVYGPNRDWVEKCLVRLKQRKPREPVGPAPRLTVRLNLPALLAEALRKEEKERQGLPPEMAQMMPSMRNIFSAMGFMTLGDLTLIMTVHADRTETVGHIPVSDFSKGLFALLDTRPSSAALRTPFVPVNAYSYGVSRANMAALIREIPTMIKEAMPAAAPQMEAALGMMDAFLGVSLERDLLAHLDTQTIAFSTVMNGQDTDVLAIQLQNEAQVKNALATIFADGNQPRVLLGAAFNEEDFLDAKLYMMKEPATDPAFALPGAQPKTPSVYALTADSGYLLFGLAPGVRHAVRALRRASPDVAFYQTPLARHLQGAIPPQAFQYAITNYEEMLKAVVNPRVYAQFQAWTAAAVREMVTDSETTSATSLLSQIDFSRWPAMAHVASFFGTSLDTAWREGNVLHVKSVYYHATRP